MLTQTNLKKYIFWPQHNRILLSSPFARFEESLLEPTKIVHKGLIVQKLRHTKIYIHSLVTVHKGLITQKLRHTAKCRVSVIKKRCKQANSTKLWEMGGAQPREKGVQGAVLWIFFDDFWSIFGKKIWSWKTEFLERLEFQKTGSYVTGRPDKLSLSLRDVSNDVSKY